MRLNWTPENRGNAQLVAKNIDGWIIIWGFAPFWIGKDKAALETVGPSPGGAFNLENRDGFYMSTGILPNGSMLPTVLPWKGDCYALNGNAVSDQPFNLVLVEVIQTC